MSSIVECNNISKFYGQQSVLDNITFKISRGSFTTLIGPNGAGKSTLSKIITTIEKPSIGSLNIGLNINIGYIPQKLDFNKNLPITVEKFLLLMIKKAKKSIFYDQLLDFCNFEQLQKIDISSLSTGQLQKILIAAIIMNNNDLLVMDEPTQSLDLQSQHNFYNILQTIRNKSGITIFMISHDLHTVMKNSDYVICLNKHICCSGRPSDDSDKVNIMKTLDDIRLYSHNHQHNHFHDN